MMKKNCFLTAAILFAAATSIVSCTNKTESGTPSGQRTEVQFTSNIVTVNPDTRATGNAWDAEDVIGIYMYEENTTNVVENRGNIPYKTELGGTNGKFASTSTVIYFPDNGNKVRFMAYSPYLGSVSTNGDVFKVNVADQSEQADIDLLYSFNTDAKFDKKTENKKVPLTFIHQLTKVYVHVKAGAGMTNDDLQDVVASFSNFNTKADFNLVNGLWGTQEEPAEIILRSLPDPKADYAACFEAIILPTPGVSTAQMVFDLKNGDTEEGTPNDIFTWPFDQKLEPATQYTFNVTLSRSGIEVEGTINDWIDTEDKDIVAE